MRIALVLLVLSTSLVLGAVPNACDLTVDPSTPDIPGAVQAAGDGASICFDSGTYSLAEAIVPRDGQTLSGQWLNGHPVATIVESGPYALNGLGATGVTYSQLAVIGGSDRAVWIGPGGSLFRVWVKQAHFGLAAYGDGIRIAYSRIDHAAETGIIGSDHTGLTIDHTWVGYSNPDCLYSSNINAGGIKISNQTDVTLSANYIVGSKGHGLWFDEGARDVTVSGNTATGQVECGNGEADGIRYEISCAGSITENIVGGNAQGIDVTSSSAVAVSSNTVSGSSAFEVRFLSDGRVPSCGSVGDGTASANVITQGAGTIVDHADGATFTEDDYVGDCAGANWVGLSFAAWQASGQDIGGSCS